MAIEDQVRTTIARTLDLAPEFVRAESEITNRRRAIRHYLEIKFDVVLPPGAEQQWETVTDAVIAIELAIAADRRAA
jgi:hypothetical protein